MMSRRSAARSSDPETAVILQRQAAGHGGAGLASTAGAFGTTFWWCLGLTVLGLAPALLLTSKRRGARPGR
jgi:hypothetical protein